MFKKRMYSLAMVICLFFTMAMAVNAQAAEGNPYGQSLEGDGGITICYAYTHSTTTILSIPSTGKSISYASLQGYQGVTTRVDITMVLQKKGGLFNLFWTDLSTWSQSFNGYSGALSKQQDVGSGTYRLNAVYKAYSGNNSETITSYSKDVKY